MKIGSHVSISNGLLGAAQEAKSYDANTFMIYTGAPRNTKRSPIEDLKIDEGLKFMEENGISDIVVHAPYIINLASYKEHTFELAVDFLKTEIERTTALKSNYIVLHPGAYTDKDREYGINRIAEGLNMVLDENTKPFICLETMAGKGTEVGSKFEDIAEIIKKVKLSKKIAVCLDTCHIHDSGYDIVNDFDSVMNEFDKIVGIELIKVIHVNGSLNKKGAKKDRHANIGADINNPKGIDHIGFDALYSIVHSSYLKDKIFILETPWINETTNLYKQEIKALRGENKNV